MVKRFVFISFLCCLSLPLAGQERKVIGTVQKIQGRATVAYFPEPAPIPLRAGMELYAGAAVRTGARSMVLIVLKGGAAKYIPADSYWLGMDQKMWERYQKSDATLREYFVLVGIKAGVKDEEKSEKAWLSAWEKGDFAGIVEMAQREKALLADPDKLYQAGMAALRIGYESGARGFLERLLLLAPGEYGARALGGIFLAWYREGKLQEAEKNLQRFKNRDGRYWKLRGLLE